MLAGAIGVAIVVIFALGSLAGIILTVIFGILFLIGLLGAIASLIRRCRHY
jgi:hypothetical protein